MKKPVFLISTAVSLAFAGANLAQEATATPSPSPSPTATPESVATAEATPRPTPASIPAPDWIKRPEIVEATPSPTPAEPAAVSDADLLPPPPDVTTADDLPPPPPDAELPSDATTDLPDPDSLIPSDPAFSENLPPEQPVAIENKFQKERELQIRYQQVRLQALKDSAVRSYLAQADKATTDEGKRQALREYYRALYAKIAAIDPALAEKSNALMNAYLRRIGQFRIAPSIPLAPPPTPEPLDLPNPSPTPKKPGRAS